MATDNSAFVKNYLISNGFIWGPESNPYGVSGFMSYGPIGKKLKSNIEQEFKRIFFKEYFDEIETPILYPLKAWLASGHIEKFGDEMFYTKSSSGQELVGRGELATTIYPLFKKLLSYYNNRLPFRIYQTGIVLTNDHCIKWQERTKQYTSHEGHIFYDSKNVDVRSVIEYLRGLAFKLMIRVGLSQDDLIFREKTLKEKPFYATKAYGLYITIDSKELELLGIQYRASNDFKNHSIATGIELKNGTSYPEVFEISFSTERPFLATVTKNLERADGRIVLKLPSCISPFQAMIMPLVNNSDMNLLCDSLFKMFKRAGLETKVSRNKSIGKRYRQADALGVPYVLTIDEKTLSASGVLTIRERDSRAQIKISYNEIKLLLEGRDNFNLNMDFFKVFFVTSGESHGG